MSEAELHVLRARMLGGYMAKARRGELATPVAGRLRVRCRRQGTARPGSPSARRGENVVRDVSAHRFSRAAARTLLSSRACASRAAHRTVRAWAILVWNELTYSRTLEVLHKPRLRRGVCTRSHAPAQARQQRAPHDAQARSQRNGRCSCATPAPELHLVGGLRGEPAHLYGNNWRTRGSQGTTPPLRRTGRCLQASCCAGCAASAWAYATTRVRGVECPGITARSDRSAALPRSARRSQAPASTRRRASSWYRGDEARWRWRSRWPCTTSSSNASTKRTGYARSRSSARGTKPKRARRRYLRVDPDNRLVADAHRGLIGNDKLRALTGRRRTTTSAAAATTPQVLGPDSASA